MDLRTAVINNICARGLLHNFWELLRRNTSQAVANEIKHESEDRYEDRNHNKRAWKEERAYRKKRQHCERIAVKVGGGPFFRWFGAEKAFNPRGRCVPDNPVLENIQFRAIGVSTIYRPIG